MVDVEATRSGVAGAYLSRAQMTALLQVAGQEGLARQQIVKRAIVRELVDCGALPELELTAIEAKQKVMVQFPHSNLKPVTELRMGREVTQEEKDNREKQAREKKEMEERAERLRRIGRGLDPDEPESKVEAVPQTRPRRRRRAR